jgi:hypothetical protein
MNLRNVFLGGALALMTIAISGVAQDQNQNYPPTPRQNYPQQQNYPPQNNSSYPQQGYGPAAMQIPAGWHHALDPR